MSIIWLFLVVAILPQNRKTIDDCAKDGSEEFFTKMQCVRIANP